MASSRNVGYVRLFAHSVAAALLMTLAAAATRLITPVHARSVVIKKGSDLDFDAIFRWQSLGPDRGGRVTTVAGVPQQPFRFYAGTVGGGVLRTDNAGNSWQRIDTKVFGSASVGAIGIAPSDPNIVYVGMGESTQRVYMSTIGDGLYKSIDGGTTWTKLGLDETRRIGAIVVHPNDPNLVYVAAMGNSWMQSDDRGVYRSRDGGKTWDKVLFVSNTTSATSLSMDARDPNVLYVATWDNIRSPWYLGSGGPGSGIYKSTDGGTTWKKLDKGLPSSMGKIAVSVSPTDSQRVYAIVEAKLDEGGVYVSRDAGATWSRVNGTIELWSRGWYFIHVYADPANADRVWVNCNELWRSDDAGKSFVKINQPHGDNHAIWINPKSPEIIVQGNDGGVTVSLDGARTWSTLYNQRSGQFWRVAVDNLVPYTVFGSQQDWGSIAVRSRHDLGGPAGSYEYDVGGGEGGYVAVDQFDSNIVYAGSELGYISRFDRRTGIKTVINAYPVFPEGTDPKDLKYRFKVNAPVLASRHTPGVIYHAANVVLRSPDRGQKWEPISPDVTRNETAKQGKGGGPFTSERIDAYDVIASFDESPIDGAVLWAGTDDGLLQMTQDGGRSWHDVTPPGVRDGEFYTITASPSNRGGAYAALTRYRLGDMRPHLFKTADYGKTWTTVSGGLPQSTYARVLKEDPHKPSLLYAGMESGVYVSFDGGASWRELGSALPTASVSGIVTADDDNDLVISTEGSAFWVLRGLTTLRQIADDAPSTLRLFTPPATYLVEGTTGGDMKRLSGPSERIGVPIDLFLTEAQAHEPQKLMVQIADRDGNLIADVLPIHGKSTAEKRLQPGLNRIYWNFRRSATPVPVQGALDGELSPVRVPAGQYLVRLTFGGETQQQPIDLRWNPIRPAPSAAATAEKQTVLRRVEDVFRDVAETVNAAAQQRATLERSNRPADLARARGLAAWELRIFDRRLVYAQGRVDYGGKLLFDLKMLHEYIENSESPIAATMKTTAEELAAEWQAIKSARPINSH